MNAIKINKTIKLISSTSSTTTTTKYTLNECNIDGLNLNDERRKVKWLLIKMFNRKSNLLIMMNEYN